MGELIYGMIVVLKEKSLTKDIFIYINLLCTNFKNTI